MPSNDSLECFGAYVKSLRLFDPVVTDLTALMNNAALHRLISLQIASADSIPSNIEEGYRRGSHREYAQETKGRYGRLNHWLPSVTVAQRVALRDDIVAILSTSIKTLRATG